MTSNDVVAVVVTYNRRVLLERCLSALATQTVFPKQVLIVDNASTDGTQDWLRDWLPENLPNGALIELGDNLGGAAGFSEGLRQAIHNGADWAWMMDDDAEPHLDALERLLDQHPDPANLYSSCPVTGDELAWPVVTIAGDRTPAPTDPTRLPALLEVAHTPFLGILVSAGLASKIGLPDAGFFLGRDDVEYCLRARCAGARVFLVGGSRIEHPRAVAYPLRLPWRTLHIYRLPPWKRYYIVRNRLFIARKYYGWSAYYSTVPATFLRLVGVLRKEPSRLLQIKATFAGLIDGLLGRKGRRHDRWKLI